MKKLLSLCALCGLVVLSNGCAEAKKPAEKVDAAKKNKIEAAEKKSEKDQETRKAAETAKEEKKEEKKDEKAKAPEAPKGGDKK